MTASSGGGAGRAPDAESVRGALAEASGTDPADWYLVSTVSHALLVVLRTVARQAGTGEVVIQPFTTAASVAPILTAGLRPRYGDLDPDTLALDPATVPEAVSAATRAVLAQHTFGQAARVARLRDLTPTGALLVEDSAHCLAELGRDSSGTPAADVSVHAFGLSRPPTRAGGAVWVNPALRGTPWHPALTHALAGLPAPGRRAALARVLGLPAMPSELRGRVAGEPTALPEAALRPAARALSERARVAEHRRRIATVYRVGLAGVAGIHVPRLLDDPGLTLLRFPVLLGSPGRAEAAFAALRAQGLTPGRWYRPTLYPGPQDPAAFGYDRASSPVAEDVSGRVLNLPTDEHVTPEAARQSVEVVTAHR